MRKRGAGIPAAIENMTAIHYVNDPKHAHAVLRRVKGIVDKLVLEADEDPLLYAYAIKGQVPTIAADIIAVEKWCTAVIDATPDQIPTVGARLCR